jgi:hypothetical protein
LGLRPVLTQVSATAILIWSIAHKALCVLTSSAVRMSFAFFRVTGDDKPWVYCYAMCPHNPCTGLQVGVNEPLTLAVSITAKVSLISGDIHTGDSKNTD